MSYMLLFACSSYSLFFLIFGIDIWWWFPDLIFQLLFWKNVNIFGLTLHNDWLYDGCHIDVSSCVLHRRRLIDVGWAAISIYFCKMGWRRPLRLLDVNIMITSNKFNGYKSCIYYIYTTYRHSTIISNCFYLYKYVFSSNLGINRSLTK